MGGDGIGGINALQNLHLAKFDELDHCSVPSQYISKQLRTENIPVMPYVATTGGSAGI